MSSNLIMSVPATETHPASGTKVHTQKSKHDDDNDNTLFIPQGTICIQTSMAG